jgi:hypothetical protein
MHRPSGNDDDDAPLYSRIRQPLKLKLEPKLNVQQCERVAATYDSVDATLFELSESQRLNSQSHSD